MFSILIKNCYSIYFSLYLLWWVSVLIIVQEEGFSPRQDLPWFFLFSGLVVLLWFTKYFLTNDRKIIFHDGMKLTNKIFHLVFIFSLTFFMIIESYDLG